MNKYNKNSTFSFSFDDIIFFLMRRQRVLMRGEGATQL